jgi:hypothetical protein
MTVSPQKVRENHQQLLNSNGPAMSWLHDRGFSDEMIAHFKLGIARAKCEAKDGTVRHLPSISIPLPNADSTHYYQKKRVAPWLPAAERPDGYKAWSQAGIPAHTFVTHQPENPKQAWLCEGEWDAIRLAWAVRHSELKNDIQVATFTCGCGNVPKAQAELDRLIGPVTLFYDRNDKPLKNGTIPGEAGAKKAALALGDRAQIALVPMPENCDIHGWDVSDALNHGYGIPDFIAASELAQSLPSVEKQAERPKNPLRDRLISTDDLIARAPDYVEWLVPDLLTTDELFGIAAPPRGGKSLMLLLLAKSVATGQNFLDRPVTQGSVIYVNLEDSDAKLKERIEAQQWTEGLPVYWLDKFKLSEIDHLIEIADEIDDLRLIVLDTLSRVRSDATTESSAEMSFVLEPLQEFAKSRKVCIVLAHHTTKINPDKNSLDEIFDTVRGSTAIRGTCRGLMVIAPADNCYRLAVENGWGKHDLKIRLDTTRLEWRLLGKWNPIVNLDQKEVVLDFLNRVGSATIETIAEQTSLPKRSLYTVLDRLRADGIIEKMGNRKAAVYQRPIQLIQQLNTLLNSSNADTESNRGAIQQKDKSSSLGDTPKSDHCSNAKGDHLYNCVTQPIIGENADSESDTAFGITWHTESQNPPTEGVSQVDHFSNSTAGGLFVEYAHTQGLKPDTESVSAIQQQFNSNSTVELENLLSDALVTNDYKKVINETPESDQPSAKSDQFAAGDQVEIFVDQKWRLAKYVRPDDRSMIAHNASGLHLSHWVERGRSRTRVRVATPDIRRREGR